MAISLRTFMLMLSVLLVQYDVGPFILAADLSYLNQSLSHDDECFILFQFKESMSTDDSAPYDPDAYSKIASWKLNKSGGRSDDCCLWEGVECSGSVKSPSRHVIGLDLSSSLLYGHINSNSSLFDLIHIRRLNLANNDFSFSQIPSGIGRLSMLTDLNLSFSNFNGQVPKEISQLNQLVSLDLHHNNFWGHIPSMAALSRLSYLDLSYNDFDGRNLSVWVGKVQNLSYLDLSFNNLSCEIPASIGNQTQLRYLYLGHNSMFGQIPSSLMNLTQLIHLVLRMNEFNGSLPSLETLSNLKLMLLGFNNFKRWKLPNWLGKLNKLMELDLCQANLYGEIPSLIFNLTQLQTLEMPHNQFEGPIPSFPSTMTHLEHLNLGVNQLQGPIPSSLSNLINVVVIFLSGNNISGTVKLDIFLPLKKLQILHLGENRITLSDVNNHTIENLPKFKSLGLSSCNLRVFPDFLRFQNQLQTLDLKDNKLDGVIPEWMGNVSKETLRKLVLSQNSITGFEHGTTVVPWVGLQILRASHNMLHGSIPMPPPTTFIYDISNNNLTGEIPPFICDMKYLQILDLSFNHITGSIPPCLGKLSNSLLMLNLRSNTLRGTIPDTFMNGSKLQIMDLSENEMEAQIPRSLVNCTSLQMLALGNNHLEDTFPFWLGVLSELQVLILRSNKFHGSIRIPSRSTSKFPKLHIIDLSYNSFSGDLPYLYFKEFSAMKKLESDSAYMQAMIEISLEFVEWSVTFPFSMLLINKGVITEYDKINQIFIALDLSSNKFGGMIPESVASLGGLQLLNLSNNELCGVIPSSLAKLTQLESLDLSGNKLTGKIPQELLRLNFLAYFNVSYNNLTGPIPQGEQFSTFQNISYMGNLGLCGIPLSKKCGNSKSSSGDEATESDFPSGIDWVIILSGVGSGLVIGLLFGNQVTESYYKWFLKRFRK